MCSKTLVLYRLIHLVCIWASFDCLFLICFICGPRYWWRASILELLTFDSHGTVILCLCCFYIPSTYSQWRRESAAFLPRVLAVAGLLSKAVRTKWWFSCCCDTLAVVQENGKQLEAQRKGITLEAEGLVLWIKTMPMSKGFTIPLLAYAPQGRVHLFSVCFTAPETLQIFNKWTAIILLRFS